MATQRTVAFTKASGVIGISVNGSVPRTLAKANNVTVKPLPEAIGVVIKLTDETFRQRVYLDDAVTKDGVAAVYANVAAMVSDLSAYFG